MDKTVAGVLGAVTALATWQAQAAPAAAPSMEAAMQASSYADLLKPIPNASELLAAEPVPEAAATPQAVPVQYFYHHHHHHHHHHQHWQSRVWHHHHHNYGYNGYYGYRRPGVRIGPFSFRY